MSNELAIEGRALIPVRLVPYATGWNISPDVLVKMLSNSDKWHRVFIPSYHLLPDKSFQKMLPKEWDVFLSDMEILNNKLHREASFKLEHYPVWRVESIKILPAGTFVWTDEIEAAYERMESRMIRPEERPGDRELKMHPYIPPKMYDVVFEGFKESSEYERAWLEFADELPKLRDELEELKAIKSKSMEDLQEKRAEIKKTETRIAEILTSPSVEAEDSKKHQETPEQRQQRITTWLDEEIKLQGQRGATQRVAVREGVSRQRIEQIVKMNKTK